MSAHAGGEAEFVTTCRRKLDALRRDRIDPFPHEFAGITQIAEVKAPFEGLEPGAETDERRLVAGRLSVRWRSSANASP
jgi:lysyl-tRNA synthetase class 2